jgi:hypothetical protein
LEKTRLLAQLGDLQRYVPCLASVFEAFGKFGVAELLSSRNMSKFVLLMARFLKRLYSKFHSMQHQF